MIRNYFLFSFRMMLRQKLFSIISLTGLSLGFASFLLIVLYLQFQYSYDQFHERKDRIYRVNRYHDGENGQLRLSTSAACVAEFANQSLSGVESAVRLSHLPLELQYQNKKFKEDYVFAADPQLFDIFSFKLLEGDGEEVLNEPNSIVLTQDLAIKIFGDQEPLNKSIVTYDPQGNKLALKVTGILENVPANSHQIFKALLSFNTLRHFKGDRWMEDDWYGCLTYLLLKENSQPDLVEEQLNALTKNILPDLGMQYSYLKLQLLPTIFFNPMKDGYSQRGSKLVTHVLLILGIFILLIACLNYINLSTARSLQRIREIGIRKVMGARKIQLIWQFLGESIFLAMISLLTAIILLQILIPAINQFSNILFMIKLDPNLITNVSFLGIAIGTALVAGIFSGIYPAFILSGFNSIKALKGKSDKQGSSFMRKVLVVIQYIVSIVMIFGSIAIFKIYDHMRSQDLGFDKENVLAINVEEYENDQRMSFLKNQLKGIHGIAGVAGTSKVPITLRNDLSYFIWNSKENKDKRISIVYIDENYFDLLHIGLVNKTDPDSFLNNTEKEVAFVNQAFFLELADQYSLGETIELYDFDKLNNRLAQAHPEIIGSVPDFIDRNLIFNRSGPIAFIVSNERLNYILVRLSGEDEQEILPEIEKTFYQVFPEHVFEYSFIDDEIDTMISIFSPFAKLIFFGAFFAIFIASIGLFALSLYITQQKTREIGVRKVFGANEKNITYLLTKQFIKLVILAFFIAGPITFWGLRFLFQIIPDQIELEWHILGIVALFIIGLGIMTVGVQSVKSARTNPVDTLRYE